MSSGQSFRFGSLAVPVLLPTLAFAIGEGAIIPIIPIVASNAGADLAVAGLIAGLFVIGGLIGNIPSGWIVARLGERPSMIGAALLSIVGVGVALLAQGIAVLAVGVFLIGLSTAAFALARHAFMTSFVPLAYRARALSTLGGTLRLGMFIGPFVAAAVIGLTGSAQAVFWVHAVACLLAAVTLLVMPDPTALFAARATASGLHEGEEFVARESAGLFRTIRDRRATLLTIGVGGALFAAIRTSRQVILPLWAVSIGLTDANAALIIGLGGALDFALFYASGQIMDRWGRLWSVLPSMAGLGVGHLVLSVTHDLPGNVTWFIAVTMVLGVANGLGSGIMMTLGADLADKRDPAPFLGAWRFTTQSGAAAAPLVVAGVTAVASVSVAAALMGVLGLAGAGIMARFVPNRPQH
ncbi:MFS transporter [Cryobacterium sp. BB307]|uniref:MFS transporter n=1 Tax=Cryobacterium sp. BB307 TaxID=2716317 RepID=UPI001447A239